jgi:D-threonate/D-erythronate kinase
MNSAPVIVFADDLTGAAEIAALAHRHGRSAEVARALVPRDFSAEVLVVDTDTRLDPPRLAASRVLGAMASAPRGARFFKKVDSVLRGAVNSECQALADALGRARVLLVPANPGLGRTLRHGRYCIDGVPLDQTGFAHDPHHPATAAGIVALLARSPGLPVHSAAPGQPLRPGSLTVGDAESGAELATWAREVSPDVLPAGGGEFFEAVLRHWQPDLPGRALAAAPSPRRTLVVLGSIAPASTAWREAAANRGAASLKVPAELLGEAPSDAAWADWEKRLGEARDRTTVVALHVEAPSPPSRDLPRRAREALAESVRRLAASAPLEHLVIAGGSTAACLLEALGWSRLGMAHEWAQGVVSLRPAEAPGSLLTLKPGSYRWPDSLDAVLFSA